MNWSLLLNNTESELAPVSSRVCKVRTGNRRVHRLVNIRELLLLGLSTGEPLVRLTQVD